MVEDEDEDEEEEELMTFSPQPLLGSYLLLALTAHGWRDKDPEHSLHYLPDHCPLLLLTRGAGQGGRRNIARE